MNEFVLPHWATIKTGTKMETNMKILISLANKIFENNFQTVFCLSNKDYKKRRFFFLLLFTPNDPMCVRLHCRGKHWQFFYRFVGTYSVAFIIFFFWTDNIPTERRRTEEPTEAARKSSKTLGKTALFSCCAMLCALILKLLYTHWLSCCIGGPRCHFQWIWLFCPGWLAGWLEWDEWATARDRAMWRVKHNYTIHK